MVSIAGDVLGIAIQIVPAVQVFNRHVVRQLCQAQRGEEQAVDPWVSLSGSELKIPFANHPKIDLFGTHRI